MATRYHFITSFHVDCEPDRVWAILEDAETWPEWWRWLRHVELIEEGDADGIGSVIRNEVTTPLGYRLKYDGRTTRSVRPQIVEFEATGDLIGIGRFRLSPTVTGTQFDFNWLVETPKWWMNLSAPIARPIFAWNHDRLMSDFADGMATRLGSRLRDIRNVSLSRDDPRFYSLPPKD